MVGKVDNIIRKIGFGIMKEGILIKVRIIKEDIMGRDMVGIIMGIGVVITLPTKDILNMVDILKTNIHHIHPQQKHLTKKEAYLSNTNHKNHKNIQFILTKHCQQI